MIYKPKAKHVRVDYQGRDIIGTERQRIVFDNDYEISVIRGCGTHSNHDTVEIAILLENNMCDLYMLNSIFEEYRLTDSVLDYVTFEELEKVCDLVGSLK